MYFRLVKSIHCCGPPLPMVLLFCSFSHSWLTVVRKYGMKNSRNNQLISVKLHAVLSTVMECHYTSLLLHPAQEVQHIHAVLSLCP